MRSLRKLARLFASAPFALAACSAPGSPAVNLSPTGSLVPATAGFAAPALKRSKPSSYLYVENNNSTISAFALASSGALEEIDGSPFASQTVGPSPFSIAVDPKSPYLYATGSESSDMAIFTIGSNGALTLSSDSTNVGTGAAAMLFTDKNKRMDVINEENGGSVGVFDVSKGGAKLKGIKGSPFSVTCPGFCDANPSVAVGSGSYLYTVDEYGWYVSAFSVSGNGALTELDSYATGDGPNDAAMTPKGTYIYVTNGVQADVSAYGVASGVLTQLAGSPFSAGNQPDAIAITPDGKYAYVANLGDGTISGYAIAAGGTLRQLPGSPFADGSSTSPDALTVDAQSKHLFVANGNAQEIAVYAIAGSGALSQIKGSPFVEQSGASGPKGLAIYR